MRRTDQRARADVARGSLATLLWRRIVREHDTEVDLGEFTRPGVLTVAAALILALLALWVSAPDSRSYGQGQGSCPVGGRFTGGPSG